MFETLASRPSRTLAQELTFTGVGLMSGETTHLRLVPSDQLPARSEQPGWWLSVQGCWRRVNEQEVLDAAGRTTALQLEGQTVLLVEHLMSALYGMGVDQVGIEVEGPELPVLDGSAQLFAQAIANVGLKPTQLLRRCYRLKEPLCFEFEGSCYALSPVDSAHSLWHCIIDYSSVPSIGLQRFDFDPRSDDYLKQISPARTFCLDQELDALRARGLIRGGSLDNAVVFTQEGSLNPLRFADEPVRHKLLDLMGDLALMGVDLLAHFSALKPSHRANNALAKFIRANLP